MGRAPRQSAARIITRESVRNIRPGQFMRDIVGELKKVTWPSREETFRLTGIVLAISLAVGLLLGLLDFGFSRFLGVTIFGD